MSLQGGGLIDGKGENWWNLPCKPHKVFLDSPLKFLSFIVLNSWFLCWFPRWVTQGINGTTLPGPCDSPIVSHIYACLPDISLDVDSMKINYSKHCQTVPLMDVLMQAIRFFMSSNLTVQGLRIKNSPQFNFRFDNCRDVHIEFIYITAPALSPNTDGIHIENTNNVKIYNSVVSNG